MVMVPEFHGLREAYGFAPPVATARDPFGIAGLLASAPRRIVRRILASDDCSGGMGKYSGL